jgi:hypothetical protein
MELKETIIDDKKSIFDIKYRKKLRNRLVNELTTLLKELPIPNNIISFVIKSTHFHIPMYFFIGFILLPKTLAVLSLVPLIICLILFLYFDGCFLTMIEQNLYNKSNKENDINIIDPFISLFGSEIDKKTQYNYTLAICITYFIVVTLVLYTRYSIDV